MSRIHPVGHPQGGINPRAANSLTCERIRLAGLVFGAIAAFVASLKLYAYSQPGQPNDITCDKDFSHTKASAEAGGKIAQYCLATLYKNGNCVAASLPEARKWYKMASYQGLNLATQDLCRPSTFADGLQRNDYAEFADLCCPQPAGLVKCYTTCPWDLTKLPFEEHRDQSTAHNC